MLLTSCAEKELPDSTIIPAGQSDVVVPTEIVATFEETKVTYDEKKQGQVYDLKPMWEVGDKIIALGEGGANYKLTVKTVNTTNRSAVLSGEVPKNCSLHLIYCPGVSASNLKVDYTAQTGAKETMPAAMFSDGEVVDGAGHFAFRNAGAIIGISAVNGVPKDTKVPSITVSGANLSSATIELDGSTLKLTATEKADDAITLGDLNLTVNDAKGTLSSPIFLAVPAGATIAKVSVPFTREPETMTIPSTAEDKKGIDYVEITAKYDGTNVTTKKWAKWNVGANSEKDYGWYFAWAGTEGYVYKNNIWVSASGVDSYSYTLKSAKTAGANAYLHVKYQSFTEYRFNWAHTPYHMGESYTTSWTKYIPTDKSTYWSGTGDPDNKLVLDLEDDAARVNWGGTWRMPTSAEFVAMKNATTWTWDADDKGCYVTEKDVPLSGDKSNALLFIPAAGNGQYASLNSAGSVGIYWTSSLWSDDPAYACYLRYDSTYLQNRVYRFYGYPVRPLSDE